MGYLVPLYCKYKKLVLFCLNNYLIRNMFNLKIKNPLELGSKFDSNYTKLSLSNSLDLNNCLFTPELSAYILGHNKDKKVFKDKQGIYLIAFRVLNKEKKSLVYNYIYYNDFLYLTLIVYFLLRNYFVIRDNHEWGKYLVILDNIFLNYDFVEKYFYLYTKDKLRYKSKV